MKDIVKRIQKNRARRRKMLQMKRAKPRKTYRQIGAAFKVSGQFAHQEISRAIADGE